MTSWKQRWQWGKPKRDSEGWLSLLPVARGHPQVAQELVWALDKGYENKRREAARMKAVQRWFAACALCDKAAAHICEKIVYQCLSYLIIWSCFCPYMALMFGSQTNLRCLRWKEKITMKNWGTFWFVLCLDTKLEDQSGANITAWNHFKKNV